MEIKLQDSLVFQIGDEFANIRLSRIYKLSVGRSKCAVLYAALLYSRLIKPSLLAENANGKLCLFKFCLNSALTALDSNGLFRRRLGFIKFAAYLISRHGK